MGNFQYNEALANVGNQLASAMLANKKSEMEAQQKAEMHNNILKFLANLQTPQPIQNTYVQPEQTARPQTFRDNQYANTRIPVPNMFDERGNQVKMYPNMSNVTGINALDMMATIPPRPILGSPFVNNQSANQGMVDMQGQQKNEAMSNILAGGGGQELATIMQLQKMGQPDWREAGSDQSGRYFYDPSNPTRVLPFTPPVAQKPQDGEWTYSTKTPDPNLYPITKTKGNTISHLYEKRGSDGQMYYDYRSEGTQPQAQPTSPLAKFNLDLSGKPLLDDIIKKDPIAGNLIKGMIEYRDNPNVAPARLAKGTNQYSQQELVALANMIDPTYDMTQFPAKSKLVTAFRTGKEAQNIRSLNTVSQHLDEFSKAAEALNNKQYTTVNSFVNEIKRLTGDKSVTDFNTASNAVSNELVTVFKNTGATDQEIEHVRNTVNSSSSPDQLRGYVQQSMKLIKGRLDALKSQYEQGMGKPADFKLLNKESKSVFNKYGIDTSDLEYQEGGNVDLSKFWKK